MKRSPARAKADPDGPAVIVCTGHRCSALLKRNAGVNHQEQLRSAVRGTSGALMIATGCIGACALAPVAAVAARNGETGRLGPAVWFAGIDQSGRAPALLQWIRDGGPASAPDPSARIPAPLADSVLGIALPATHI
jgi:hypothetical protein